MTTISNNGKFLKGQRFKGPKHTWIVTGVWHRALKPDDDGNDRWGEFAEYDLLRADGARVKYVTRTQLIELIQDGKLIVL